MIDDNQRLKVRSWRAPAINHTSKEALSVTTEPNSRNRRPQSNDADFVGMCNGRLTVLLAAQGSGRCEPSKQELRNHATRRRHGHYLYIAESLPLSPETLAAIS
ncbi:hypothetical protein CDEST_00076 [Colletotrichum destructivum]|uniref:Uncharacterized protein n=1 Tax=Colletotrichum destructivum TaxID=34406 RepID=A0AAX4HWC2_9PEZI|nr:hypothetical protein CDEST_00076 [Colletotrichum destructivum]